MDLMAQLPWRVYHDQEHVADFQRAWGKELDVLIAARDDLYRQMRPGTATWGLALFEREYGILPDPGKALEKRRGLWRAKRRGRGTTTTAVLQQTAELVTGLPAEVVEYPELDYFEILIHARQQPMDIRDLVRIVEEIKPAHLGMVFAWRVTARQAVQVGTGADTRFRRRAILSPPEKQRLRTAVHVAAGGFSRIVQKGGITHE